MWIRTKCGGWYVYELRGVNFVSWVSVEDKGLAGCFPPEKAMDWVRILEDMTGKKLEAVQPF